MVSCSSCGAWHEVASNESPQGWICPQCRGQHAPKAASPNDLSGTGPIGGEGPATLGRPSRIGGDSGQIGSASLSSAQASLQKQLNEMRSAVDSIRIGSADLQEISDRLANSAQAVSVPPVDERPAPSAAGVVEILPLSAALPAAEPPEGRPRPSPTPAAGAAQPYHDHRQKPQQAHPASVKAKPASPIPMAGSKPAGGHDEVKRAIPQTETVCLLCGDRIVLGDRVTSCSQCGEHYHADCYKLLGSCVSPQCRTKSQGYDLASPSRGAPPAGPQATSQTGTQRHCTACGAAVPLQALVCAKCGQWLSTRTSRPGQKDSSSSAIPAGCIVAAIIFFFLIFFSLMLRH
jgi:predicted nucleic acid-binding Zn ribbon protein